MLVSETQYAAAYYDASSDAGYRIFDDIGCMVRHLKSTRTTPSLSWVHDFSRNSWIRTDSATYVYSRGITTPMNYGYVAFRVRSEAERFASAHNGRVLADLAGVMNALDEIAQ
jgi:hypothetical protein